MKQPVRFFAIGLFTASLAILLIFLFTNSSHEASDLTTEQLIEHIEEDGYRVITEDEYITFAVNKDLASENSDANDQKKKDKQKDTNNKKENKESKKDVKSYTVKVKSGMMPEEIAQLLEDNNIIDDAFSFATYLEDNGYSPYVQIDSYKLTSDMSKKEIAEKITKNRRP